MQVVEVFKTNVTNSEQAQVILIRLKAELPKAQVSFDLEDCDKILRISNETIDLKIINRIARETGIECSMLF